MDPNFWHDRWQQRQTGFHQAEVNSMLEAFWPPRIGSVSARVFVPLCGKSLDMIWLRERGHSVLGSELSPIAIDEFFRENGISAETKPLKEGFVCTEKDGIRLLCGNFLT